jgi:hypothetical protein
MKVSPALKAGPSSNTRTEYRRREANTVLKGKNGWVIIGYTGRLLVDAQRAELVRLIVRTDELPEETDACETDSTLEYGMVQLGNGDYLLPKLARQRFIGRDGGEAENTMSFSACREFQAESKLPFGAGATPETQDLSGAVMSVWNVPAGLPVAVELTTAIQQDAAAGDRIQGRLIGPIRKPGDRKVLIPEGTRPAGFALGTMIRPIAIRVGNLIEVLLDRANEGCRTCTDLLFPRVD